MDDYWENPGNLEIRIMQSMKMWDGTRRANHIGMPGSVEGNQKQGPQQSRKNTQGRPICHVDLSLSSPQGFSLH